MSVSARGLGPARAMCHVRSGRPLASATIGHFLLVLIPADMRKVSQVELSELLGARRFAVQLAAQAADFVLQKEEAR